MRQAICGLLIHNNKLLIGKKVIKEGHFCSGGWHIPGGNAKKDESLEECLKREFKEETNINVEIVEKIDEHYYNDFDLILHYFLIKPSVNTISPTPSDDLTEIKFIKCSEALTECDIRAVSRWPQGIIDFLSNFDQLTIR